MKFLTSLIILIHACLGFSQVVEKFKLNMKIPALTENYVELYRYDGHDQVFIDSIRFGANGLAKYSAQNIEKGLYNLILPNTNSFELIITESKVYFETSLITPSKSMVVKKSVENQQYYGLQHFVANERKQVLLKYKEYQTGAVDLAGFEEYQEASSKRVRAEKLRVVKDYPQLLVSDLLLAGMNPILDTASSTYQEYLNQYLDNIHFENPALLNSPLMYSRVVEFLDQMVAPFPEEKIKYIDIIMSRCATTPKTKQYLSTMLIEHFQKFEIVGNDEVFVHLVNKYLPDTSFEDSNKRKLKGIASTISMYVRGESFSPRSVKGIEELEQLDSKYTLVVVFDKEASKRELELIYNFSKSYEPKGVKVCGVRIDGTEEQLHLGHKKDWILIDGDISLKTELYMKEHSMLILLDRSKKVLARDITLDFLIDTINAWEK